MSDSFDLSVVICTYNRCDLLPGALEQVLAQATDGGSYEVIVVDNNSTDETRQVVESFLARGHANLRYVFEVKQGLSHARNAGIAVARAAIISFTDDDVSVARDWVANIKRALDERPEVDYVGGKVLPRWQSEPPAWLTPDHWGPLALVDYGDAPFYVNRDKAVCLVGANLSFRREVFERIGLFTPDFQRVKDSIGSLEDHEFQLRLWFAGGQGMYVPEIVVAAEVQAERMVKAYHRRWHTGHGTYGAMIRLKEITRPGGRLVGQRKYITLFGVPSFLFSGLLGNSGYWLLATLLGRKPQAFMRENRLRFLVSYIRKYNEMRAAEGKDTAAQHVLSDRGVE